MTDWKDCGHCDSPSEHAMHTRIAELESRLDSLRQNLAVAHDILNQAMAEQDYHVDVSRTAVWLASNEGVVENQRKNSDGV